MDLRLIHFTANFNPLAPHGARLQQLLHDQQEFAISILSPRTGRDGNERAQDPDRGQFQSSRPARGETAQQQIR